MNLNEFDNEQILFLFFSNKELYDSYNGILEKGEYHSSLDLLDVGNIIVTHLMKEEDLSKIKESKHYNYVLKMHEKLEPIALLIEEANPKLYQKVQAVINDRSLI